jgi:hypothetical protein
MAGRHLQDFVCAIKACQLAQTKFEGVLARLHQVFNFFSGGVKTASSQLVQQRLPQMGACGVHQHDVGQLFLAQLGGQCQAARAYANDDDTLRTTPCFGLDAILPACLLACCFRTPDSRGCGGPPVLYWMRMASHGYSNCCFNKRRVMARATTPAAIVAGQCALG